MTRIAIALYCALALLPALSSAQAPEIRQFAYCEVQDDGGHDIWVSQLFEFTVPEGPSGWLAETQRMATEFHAHVATLGGAGAKSCQSGARQDLENLRANSKATLTARFMGVIRAYKWRDVQWTPSTRSADAWAVATTPVTKYVYCQVVDSDTGKMVTTKIFSMNMPPATSSEYAEESSRFQREWAGYLAAVHKVQSLSFCIEKDTFAEAQKDLADFKKMFRLTGVKKIEESWQPSAQPIKTVTNPTIAAAPAAPVTPAPPAPAKPAAPDTGDVETDYWNRIVGSQHADDFDDYLKAFPNGKHAPLANLEAKRLRRDGATAIAPRASAPTAAHSVAPSVPAPSALTVASNASISERLANEAFFQIPAPEGSGVPIRRSGTRTVSTIPVTTTTALERIADSNLCRLDLNISTGGRVATHNVTQGTAWAGFIPVEVTMRLDTGAAPITGTLTIQQVDELVGQPFPLVAGSRFSFRMIAKNVLSTGLTSNDPLTYSCEVGATGPAQDVIAGMPGNQTELKCTMSFHNNVVPPQHIVMQWFSAAGCFAQDPSRP